MAEIEGQPERPWSDWARYLELGTGSTWGSLLIDGGAITERAVALQVGQRLDALVSDSELTVDQVQQILTETLEGDDEIMGQVLSWFRQHRASR